jgi:small subunit ribosomal protein S13
MLSKSYKILNKSLLEYGLGTKIRNTLFKKIGVNTRIHCENYKFKVINRIEKIKRKLVFGKKLILKIKKRKKFLITLNTFKGLRHQLKKPVRGQRTKTNAKTAKKVNSSNGKR